MRLWLRRCRRGPAPQIQVARRTADTPFIINSGCRCEKHNASSRGSRCSAHMSGLAADIHCIVPTDRSRILPALISAGFTRIGISATFIHVDVDNVKTQNVIWVY